MVWMIGSVSYVRVYYMCSGSVLRMIVLEILSWKTWTICWVEEFSALNNFERTGFVLGCENWERYNFKALLRLVKIFILLTWDTRKNKLDGDQDGNGETSGCSCS